MPVNLIKFLGEKSIYLRFCAVNVRHVNKVKIMSYVQYIDKPIIKKALLVLLSIGMFVATAGYNIFWDGSKFHTAFYLCLLLPGLVYVAMDLNVLKRVYHNPVTILALVYLFTAVLSAFYPGTVNSPEKELIQVTLIVLSLFVIAQFVTKNPELFTKILVIGVVAVALAAFYHLYKYYFVEGNSYTRRLSGYLLPGNPLHLAGSYGFSFMASILLLIKYRRQPLMVALLAVSGGTIFLAIIATQSRSFFLALLTAMVISYVGRGKKSVILIILFTITVILLGLYLNPEILGRTQFYRLQIWQDVLQLILEKPLFGWGADYDPTIKMAGDTFIDTHNIFLMVWLKYGALSLVALLLLYGYSLVVIMKNRDNELLRLGGALLVFGVSMLFFEGHDIITKPNRMWLMVWVPIGIVMGAEFARVQLNRKADY